MDTRDRGARAGNGGPAAVTAAHDLDWEAVGSRLDEVGVAVTPPLLTAQECRELVEAFDEPGLFRSTVVMQRYNYGRGVYRYFADPLPPLVTRLREALYPPLARIANGWAERLGERRFPPAHRELAAECARNGQTRPTPLMLRYGAGDYTCLHQDLYGDVVFPLQVAVMLNEPDVDFTGGESVFVEQRPRAQSRALVLRPGLGQGLVFAVRHRPVRGTRGDRRHVLRHGVSDVLSGERHVLGVIFHNAR